MYRFADNVVETSTATTTAAPPIPAIRAVHAAIDCLWASGAEGDHQDCSDLPSRDDDG